MKDTVTNKRSLLLTIAVITFLIVIFSYRYHIYIFYVHTLQYATSARVDTNIYNDASQDPAVLNETAPRRFVIMSVSMVERGNFYYMLHAPYCALAWRRLGYEPLLFIVKPQNDTLSPLTAKTVEYLTKLKIRVMYIDAPVSYIKHVAMLVRLFVGLLPDEVAADQDLILTSDTDFFPLNRNYFTFLNTNAITLLDARNVHFKYKGAKYEMPEVLIPYIGMRKWQWRAVMRVKRGDPLTGKTVLDKVKEIHGDNSFAADGQMQRGNEAWFLDQRTVTIAINEFVKSGRGKVNRYPYVGLRLNRGWRQLWYIMLERLDEVTDSHLPQADSFEFKDCIFALLRRVYSPSVVAVFDRYFTEFKALM
jgi:hypothetical protein